MQRLKHENDPFSPRILLIEPEENISEFIRLGLRYEGYQVESFQRGLEALEAVRRIQPQLIILELVLPDIAGLELCRQLRTEEVMHERPLLVLTQLKDTRIQLQAREAGVSAYLTRPFSFDQLLEQIRLLAPAPQSRVLSPSSLYEHDFLGKGFPPGWWSQDKRPLAD